LRIPVMILLTGSCEGVEDWFDIECPRISFPTLDNEEIEKIHRTGQRISRTPCGMAIWF